MRKLLVGVLVSGLVGASAAPAPAATTPVIVGDNFFVRDGAAPTVIVPRNTRVKWIWTGKSLHNVKVAKGPARFGSPSQRSGSYAKKVKRAGTYRIICTVHGADDQRMKLVVR